MSQRAPRVSKEQISKIDLKLDLWHLLLLYLLEWYVFLFYSC